MNVNFNYKEAGSNDPVVFEEIFAEKPAGGLVANQTYDLKAGTAVGFDGQILKPIKGYRVVEDAVSNATSIKIAKGSGIASGDVIGVNAKGVACTAVDQTNADYDVVTVTLGVAVSAGRVLYQAKSAGSSAEPIYSPEYLIGNSIEANKGDQMVRLVNGANIRKETAPVASEVVAKMKSIQLV